MMKSRNILAVLALIVGTSVAACATLRGQPPEPEPQILWTFPDAGDVLVTTTSIFVWSDATVTRYDLDDAGRLLGPVWTKSGVERAGPCNLIGYPGPQGSGRTARPLALNQAHFADSGLLILPLPCVDQLLVDPATGKTISKRRGRLYGTTTKYEVVERGRLKFWRDKKGTFWVRAGGHWMSAESAFFCQKRVFVHRDGVAREIDLQQSHLRTIGEPIPIRGARTSDAFGLYRGEPRYLARHGYFSPDGFHSYFEKDLGSLHAIAETGLVFREPYNSPFYGTNLMPGFERCCSYDILMSGHDPQCEQIPK